MPALGSCLISAGISVLSEIHTPDEMLCGESRWGISDLILKENGYFHIFFTKFFYNFFAAYEKMGRK
jgi:hypothetical protein